MAALPQPMEHLIKMLARLPAIGRRSAERIAFRLLSRNDRVLPDLLAALTEAQRTLGTCSRCGAITFREQNPCAICTDESRERVLCLVEEASDVIAIEQTGGFHGRYHVLGGRLSPMKGIGPAELRLEPLKARIREERVTEVILALNTDVESDATAHFIREQVAPEGVRCSRLAYGLPAGSGVEYMDALTLERAVKGRADW